MKAAETHPRLEESLKGPFHLTYYPHYQPVLGEFSGEVAYHRQGVNVVIWDERNPEIPMWSKFVPKEAMTFFYIRSFENRIVRTVKKAGKIRDQFNDQVLALEV